MARGIFGHQGLKTLLLLLLLLDTNVTIINR
jgi:hypothetical protein